MKEILRILSVILITFMWSCKEPIHMTSSEYERITIDESIEPDIELEDMISPYRNRIKDEMDKPLAYNVNTMLKTDTPYNTGIGNMMADAVLEMANPIFESRHQKQIDAVILNYGGIRAGMGEGVVTVRNAYEIMPFENMVVVAKLEGQQMKELIDFLASAKNAEPIANMTLKFDSQGIAVTQDINGEAFDIEKTYYVATSDYQAGNSDFFQKAKAIYNIDYKLRTLFIDYFDKQDTINYSSDDRLIKLK